jgi:hypothetical protein
VFAFIADPAIDWEASAELLGCKPEEAQATYSKRGAEASLPLAAKAGEVITEVWCKPLDYKTNMDIRDRHCGESARGRDTVRMHTEVCEASVVEVKNFGSEYKGVESMTPSQRQEIGLRVFVINQLSQDEMLF